jgi:hypothetical protein
VKPLSLGWIQWGDRSQILCWQRGFVNAKNRDCAARGRFAAQYSPKENGFFTLRPASDKDYTERGMGKRFRRRIK